MNPFSRIPLLTALALSCLSSPNFAVEPDAALIHQNGQFTPPLLIVPSGKKVRLRIENLETESMELESETLAVEIVIPPQHTTIIHIGPLAPGRYDYFNDDNPQEKGVIVAQ
ncbi:MAG: cupredoxin domain-containing protein [Betaproteobacteria bacterium]|jgi:hypothetical protein|nr:cupredoxin domain-containing protein [Betaproteobacteria bacterium]